MSERDELARHLKPDLGCCVDCPQDHRTTAVEYALEVADSLLSAGYRKPRTITTAEELDALRLPAIIDSPSGGPAKVEYYFGPGSRKYVEPLFGDDEDDESYSLVFFATFGLPATVLCEARS